VAEELSHRLKKWSITCR